MAVCRKCIIAVEEDQVSQGYYTVAVYLQGDAGVIPGSQMYRKLSWTEAVDVMLVTFEENRPGMDFGAMCVQNKLW